MAKRRAAGEGGLFQRKSGRHKGKWVARIECGRNGKGHPIRKDLLFDTQAEAKEKLKEMVRDKDKGRQPAGRSPRLSDYLEDWLSNRVKARVSPNTYDRYRSAVTAHIKPDAISDLKLREIRAAMINDFMDRLAKQETGVATRTSVRAVLSAALQQALKEELVYDNQARTSDAPRQEERKIKFLTVDEAKKLMNAAKGDPLEPLIVTAIYSGMRLSELLGLTWDRIDFTRSTITIDQQLQRHEGAFYLAPLKTRGGRRTVPMAEIVADKLKALKGGMV
ncbi:MAG: site-specific integrase, partial [Fimbriimonadaceae bacterium]